ncbi:hypothetical protein [Actinobaculum sp. 352]|uniref:hypothetical protein n=1 Tax=Actinobaculum sp. 352 TaxID=2490946 RepID=UPI000F7F2C26|nr:hypothetical protein [Actinobaculum sp. 352]RTE49550.1 hypothetical protein EKN07_05720 [Actinobaculum sp. 352]
MASFIVIPGGVLLPGISHVLLVFVGEGGGTRAICPRGERYGPGPDDAAELGPICPRGERYGR